MNARHETDFFGPVPDILVIGGGLAALTAALSAHEQGRSVAMVSLGPVGRSGNTLMAENTIAGVTGAPGNTVQAYIDDVLRSGRGLSDPGIVARLARDSHAGLLWLREYGVPLEWKDGDFALMPPVGGHSVPRSVMAHAKSAAGGRAFPGPLARAAGDARIPMFGGLRAVRLLRKDDRVCGALFLERKTGRCRCFFAGRIILATGGYAGLYASTSNAGDSYGDGAALALQAGCPLRDMEMVQFFPVILRGSIRTVVTTKVYPFGAVLRNNAGDRFMARYGAADAVATRDVMARAIFMEIRAGRGIDGGIFVDCTAIAEQVFRDVLYDLDERLRRCGVDPRKDMLKGAPGAHYSMGGVVVDEHGRTPVPGLYAAGEVCGGLHGANRLGGAALMEAVVFGRAAGIAACADELPAARPDVRELPSPIDERDAKVLAEEIKRLRRVLWDDVSLVREARGLDSALCRIREMRDAWALSRHAQGEMFSATLAVAEAVAHGALLRAESRGAHYRSDYPETDAARAAAITCALRGNGLEFTTRPAAGCAEI